MPTTYTPTATSIAAGAAVPITDPADGDLLTAASNNTGQDKLGDYLKQLFNQALLTGKTPSYSDALSNGLLWAEKVASGALRRCYLLSTGIWITDNASWNGSVWSRDTGSAHSRAYRLAGPGTGNQGFDLFHYEAAAADGWATANWKRQFYGTGGGGGDPGAGVGLLGIDSLQDVSSSVGFTNSWVNYGSPFSNAAYHKDPAGRVTLMGTIKDGTWGSAAFTLPASCRPAATRTFGLLYCGPPASGYAWLSISSAGVVTPIASAGSTQTFVSLEGINFIA